MIKYLVEKQRKLTAALIGSVILAAGCYLPADRYSAFSLAVAGIWGAVIAGAAFGKQPGQPVQNG